MEKSYNDHDDANLFGWLVSKSVLSQSPNEMDDPEYFANVMWTIIEKLFAVNPSQTGMLSLKYHKISYLMSSLCCLIFKKNIWMKFK